MAYKWSEDGIWSLITEIKSSENFKVLYGQSTDENSSGDSKVQVYQRIGTAIFPEEVTQLGAVKLGSRVKNKVTWLESTFKKKVKLLKKTGEGVEEYYYISPTGPDHDTNERARTIWEKIVKEFKYFPDLYRVWSTKPNLVPICATTGVGPPGAAQTILIQAENTSSASSSQPSTLSPSHSESSVGSSASAATSLESPASTPFPPSTPAHSSTNKENAAPPPSSQRGPRSSAFSSLSSLSGDKGQVKTPVAVPQRTGFEDKIVSLQRDMMKSIEKRAKESQSLKRAREDRKLEDQRLKRRRLLQEAHSQLLAEYKANLLDPEEYREERKRLDELYASPKKQHQHRREPSPDWDEDRLHQDMSGDEL